MLREAINQKYKMTDVLGQGSYGTVSKGICKATGREVALKVMVNQTTTEYDAIKVLREIQLMKRLNDLSATALKELKLKDKEINGKNLFVPELIDVICPVAKGGTSCPSSGNAFSLDTNNTSEVDQMFVDVDLNGSKDQNTAEGIVLNNICLVMEYLESDIDQLLKNKIEF